MRRNKQTGNAIVTVLIVLAILGFGLACFKPASLPDKIRDVLPDKQQSNNNQNNGSGNDGYYDDYADDVKPRGVYTVQVLATPNRQEAFDYKYALVKDGYSARVEEGRYSNHGIYYKVRIGKYNHQNEALGVRDRIKRTYIKHFHDSFVYRY